MMGVEEMRPGETYLRSVRHCKYIRKELGLYPSDSGLLLKLLEFEKDPWAAVERKDQR